MAKEETNQAPGFKIYLVGTNAQKAALIGPYHGNLACFETVQMAVNHMVETHQTSPLSSDSGILMIDVVSTLNQDLDTSKLEQLRDAGITIPTVYLHGKAEPVEPLQEAQSKGLVHHFEPRNGGSYRSLNRIINKTVDQFNAQQKEGTMDNQETKIPQKRDLVIYVEDERLVREATAELLGLDYNSVRPFTNAEDALAAIKNMSAEELSKAILVTDFNLDKGQGNMTGGDLLSKLHEEKIALPSMLLTGISDNFALIENPEAKVDLMLTKPVGGLLDKVQEAVKKFDTGRGAQQASAEVTELGAQIPNDSITKNTGQGRC